MPFRLMTRKNNLPFYSSDGAVLIQNLETGDCFYLPVDENLIEIFPELADHELRKEKELPKDSPLEGAKPNIVPNFVAGSSETVLPRRSTRQKTASTAASPSTSSQNATSSAAAWIHSKK